MRRKLAEQKSFPPLCLKKELSWGHIRPWWGSWGLREWPLTCITCCPSHSIATAKNIAFTSQSSLMCIGPSKSYESWGPLGHHCPGAVGAELFGVLINRAKRLPKIVQSYREPHMWKLWWAPGPHAPMKDCSWQRVEEEVQTGAGPPCDPTASRKLGLDHGLCLGRERGCSIKAWQSLSRVSWHGPWGFGGEVGHCLYLLIALHTNTAPTTALSSHVWVSWGCSTAHWVAETTFISYRSGAREVQDQDPVWWGSLPSLQTVTFLLCPHVVESRGRTLTPFMMTPSLGTKLPPKVSTF